MPSVNPIGWKYVAVENDEGEVWLHQLFPDLGYGAEPTCMGANSVEELADTLRTVADEIDPPKVEQVGREANRVWKEYAEEGLEQVRREESQRCAAIVRHLAARFHGSRHVLETAAREIEND